MKYFSFLIVFLYVNIGFAQNTQIDVTDYNIALTLQPKTLSIKAEAIISIKLLKATSNIQLDFVADKNSQKGLKISEVLLLNSSNKIPLAYKYVDEKIDIDLKNNLKQDAEIKLLIKYHGKPVDGLIIDKNLHGDTTFFADNWPNRAHYWFPSNDHPSDKATVTFSVETPHAYQVIANGICSQKSYVSSNSSLTIWEQKQPIPTKVMVIGAAKFAVEKSCTIKGTEISSWVYNQQKEDGFKDYAEACDVLAYFNKLLIKYPFDKLANVQSKTKYGGMENASCIFYHENSVTGKQDQEALLAHEIAHQWFGNSLSEKSWEHIWLSEGFATYLANRYLSTIYDDKYRQTRMASERKKAIDFSKKVKRPIVDTLYKNINELLNPNSYQKASWVLYMLEQQIGNKAMVNVLQKFYFSYQYKNANTKEFINIAERVSRKELSPFFKQWLYTADHPILSSKIKNKRGQVEVRIQQHQSTTFTFPIEIGFKNQEGSLEIHRFEVNAKEQVVILPSPLKVDEIVLDPNVKLFFEELN